LQPLDLAGSLVLARNTAWPLISGNISLCSDHEGTYSFQYSLSRTLHVSTYVHLFSPLNLFPSFTIFLHWLSLSFTDYLFPSSTTSFLHQLSFILDPQPCPPKKLVVLSTRLSSSLVDDPRIG
jgi:hypothetical protein